MRVMPRWGRCANVEAEPCNSKHNLHIYHMPENYKVAVPRSELGLKVPERNRIAVLSTAAERKRLRDRDASLAMKEHEARRLATLATTARLRAERLARFADAPPAVKAKPRKKV